MLTLEKGEPLALAVTEAIQTGDVDMLRSLLEEHPGLATSRIVDERRCGRSLLHVATDFPGLYPQRVQTLQLLLAAGADINVRFVGFHSETPLHWAASNDDVAMVEALLEAGADIEADGGVIGNGTPLADAVAFGQWQAARALLSRGAQTTLWQAAALGLMDRLTIEATPDEITNAFWCACHGGQREAAAFLLNHGAQLNWVGYDGLTPLQAAERSQATELVRWLRERGAQ
ncbi:MAG TPA: hypothetical protein DGG94_03220 [Micromonosporaceae bacterium]|nr:hypothetical protein [Micromonosporaceae bacterium]HCU48826.1 hypothetical protein [Micromonosporaceae bacterium]